ERERASVVDHFGEPDLGQVVLRDRIGRQGRDHRLFDAPPLVGFGAEQQRRRWRAPLQSGVKLGGRHVQNALSSALTTPRATSLLKRSIAVPLSSKYAAGSTEIS